MTAESALRTETAAAVRLAAPIVLVQLGSMLMGTVDVMMLGRSSEAALASGGVGNALMLGMTVFPTGLLMALDPLVSQAHGAGDAARLSRFFKQGLVLALALAVPIALVIWQARTVLQLVGQPPEIVDGASAYMRAAMASVPALLLYITVQRTLQAMSIVRPAFVAMVAANVVNFLADYVLIFGHAGFPALGVAGAGWATSAARWVMVLCVVTLARDTLRRYWAERLGGLKRLLAYGTFLRIGGPIGVHISLEYWLFMCVTLMMGHLGVAAAAGHQVAITMTAIVYMVALGLAEAGATRVGNAIGRRDMPGARRSAAVALGLGTAVMAGLSALLFFFPRFLSRLFTPEPEVIALAASLLPIAAFFEIFDGIQAVSGGVLRGAADTRVPATVALVGYWLLGLPLGAFLTFRGGMGPQGLWWGLTFGLLSAAVLLLLRVVRRFRGEIAAVA